MDKITKALLEEFVLQNNLSNLTEDKAFERFAGAMVISSYFSENVNTEDIAVGEGGDGGIDCIAIFANGVLVTEPEEIDDLSTTNGYLDVTFVFTQAERSSNFDTSKIGQFAFGVRDFFGDKPQLVQNEAVVHCSRIAKEIFDRSTQFKKGNPQCLLYYVTTGKWSDDQNLKARRDSEQRDIESLNIFRKVVFECVDADRLQKMFHESKNAISTEIIFADRTLIPEMQGVEQAYIGLLPANQFLKLITNDAGEIMASLFYDNVRHWQEWNEVNKEIQETLSDSHKRIFFPLLNNGVTIVAKQVSPTGNKFLLDDYQVVNGCQTSYVLHDARALLTDDIKIPVRIIATKDEEIKNSIIRATNRQTQIGEDQFFALSEFPKKLELFFPTFETKRKLYYERRSRQYNGTPSIEKVRVINMTILVRAFAAMFLELPHRTTRNYKALLKSVGTEIFGKEHRLEPYYVCAYAHYRLEYLYRSTLLSNALKPARYHILMAFRKLTDSNPLPRMNSHEMRRYCEKFTSVLWDDDKSKKQFEESANLVSKIAGGNLHRDNIRTEHFTDRLKKEFET